MDCIHEEYSFPSKTGITDIFVQSVAPADKNDVRGIIQIVHGMAEYSDRYLDVAGFLANKGYAVFMHDHAGHGKSVKRKEDLGYFGENDGNEKIVDDTKEVSELAKKHYPGKKLVIWGHSMGSFVTRRYIAKYGSCADAAIICGTSGANPGAGVGAALARMIGKSKGSHYRSKFIDNLAFGSYNKKFTGSTGFEWLSANEENVKKYVADDMCGYLFSAYAFRDMFKLLGSVSTKEWYQSVPKETPLYLIAGEMDPVGNYGKGVKEVCDNLVATGHANVKMKLYPGLRHEIHNESSNAEVYNDVCTFADGICK